MKKIWFVWVVAAFSIFVVADDVRILSVEHDFAEEKIESGIERLVFNFSGSGFKFKISREDSRSLKIIVTPDDTIDGTVLPPEKMLTPGSAKIIGITYVREEKELVIKITLNNKYVYKASKFGEKLNVYIHPEIYQEPEAKKNLFEKSSYDEKYKSWEEKIAGQKDFFYRGFVLLTLNYAVIEGNTLSYSNGIFEFDEGFSSRQKVSFMGDGQIFDDYCLSVQAFYDPLDDSGFDYKPIRDLYFYAKMEQGLNYLSIGDHDKESFTNLHLSRFTQSFLGVEAHIETRPVAATAFAAVSKGGVQVQEFQADNTTGPYQMNRTPIVAGSEFVTIEERDKNSPTRIINTTAQTRGVDYFVNYEEGEITFVTPVAKETFDRNPLYIVIRYQYERVGAGKEYLAAAQIEGRPFEFMNIGASYISKFTDEGFGQRDQIFGLNAAVNAGEEAQVFAEYALSKPIGKDGEEAGAYYLTMQGKLGNDLRYRGTYQRIEAGFENIANRRLEFYNDQIRMDGEVIFSLDQNNLFTLGYRSEESNVSHSEGNPAISNSSVYGQWQMNYTFLPVITVRFDHINKNDDKDESEKSIDSKTDEITINAEKYFSILGETGILGIFRYSDNTDKINMDNNSTMNLYGFRLVNKPTSRYLLFAEYRKEHKESESTAGETYDYDIIGVGGRMTPFTNFSIDIRWEDRAKENLLLGVSESAENIISIGGNYVMSSSLRFLGRYEEREFENFFDASTNQFSRTANIRFFAHLLTNLRIGLGYELEDRMYTGGSNNRSYEDRLLVEGSYKKKEVFELYARYQLDLNKEEFSPLPITEARNNINLVGLRFWIGERFDFLGRYKTQKITGVNDNTLTTFTFEAGYRAFEKYKFILGYESAEFDHPTALSDNFEADNFYLRLAAIL